MFLIRKVLKQESWLERDGSSVSQGLLVTKVTLEIGDHGKGSLPIEKVRNFREFSLLWENQMEKIFFAFLDKLAHSKQFKKSRENDLLLTPPPFFGKIPENSGLFLLEGFPYLDTTRAIFLASSSPQ